MLNEWHLVLEQSVFRLKIVACGVETVPGIQTREEN